MSQLARRTRSIAFLYLGRRGALGQITLELAQAAAGSAAATHFIVSSSNETISALRSNVESVIEVPTFESTSSLAMIRGFFNTRAALLFQLDKIRPDAVVTLMPHIYSPLLAPAIKRLGIKYATIIHDGGAHPGDKTAIATRWLLRDAHSADLVITLSKAVARQLTSQRGIEAEKILSLFLPDLSFGKPQPRRSLSLHSPPRILFFGRIMAYKGLEFFIDAIAQLKASGQPVECAVIGSGDISTASMLRLRELDAEVINRWIKDDEIGGILDRFDVMACSHLEASQSGVVAAAFGHAMPVVAMPTGGITEQVIDGQSGVLAADVSAGAFAGALARLLTTPGLYDHIATQLVATAQERSMQRFLAEIINGLSEENHTSPPCAL